MNVIYCILFEYVRKQTMINQKQYINMDKRDDQVKLFL